MEDSGSQLWRGVAYTDAGRCLGEHIVRGDSASHAQQLLAEWFESIWQGSGQLDMARMVSRPPVVSVSKAPRLWPVEPPAGAPEQRSVPAGQRYR